VKLNAPKPSEASENQELAWSPSVTRTFDLLGGNAGEISLSGLFCPQKTRRVSIDLLTLFSPFTRI